MGDIMTFPKRWEDFLHDYEFEDARRIYTNGSRLIQSFRVKQMMEHYAPVLRCKDCKYWHDNNDGYTHEECRWGTEKRRTPMTFAAMENGKRVLTDGLL